MLCIIFRRENPTYTYQCCPLPRCSEAWFYDGFIHSARETPLLEGSTCALPSALLVWWCVIPVHRVLDVGQSNDDSPYLFTGDTTAVMSMLMSSLPCLTHLDISGTNLAGFVKEQPESHRLTPYSTVRHENHELPAYLRLFVEVKGKSKGEGV